MREHSSVRASVHPFSDRRRWSGTCPTPRRGHRCKRRTCPSCGRLWAGDTRKKLFVNFVAYGGEAGLITVTAPSLPWDRSACTHDLSEGCSGLRGCRVDPQQAWMWNESAPRRWRALHNAASQYVRRKMPGQLEILGLAWEYQRRGLLHRHVVVGMKTWPQRQAAELYAQRLKALNAAWEFGFVDGKISGRPARESAAYLSSYFISGSGGKAAIRETVMRRDVPPMVVYISRELTKVTGCTMRSLRHDRYLHALAARYGVTGAGAQAVADYIKNTRICPALVITTVTGWLVVRETTGEIDDLSGHQMPRGADGVREAGHAGLRPLELV